MTDDTLTRAEVREIKEKSAKLEIFRFAVPEYDKAKIAYERIGQIEVTGVAELQISPDCKYGVPLCEAMVMACMEMPALVRTIEAMVEALGQIADAPIYRESKTSRHKHCAYCEMYEPMHDKACLKTIARKAMKGWLE